MVISTDHNDILSRDDRRLCRCCQAPRLRRPSSGAADFDAGGSRARRCSLPSVKLLAYTDADLRLTEALETDPGVMHELGGPIPMSAVLDAHQRRLHDP